MPMNKQQVQAIMATRGATIVPHLFSLLSAAPDKTATALRTLEDETLLVTVWMLSPDNFLIEACMHEEAWWLRENYARTNDVLVQLGVPPDDQDRWESFTPQAEITMEDHNWIRETVEEIVRKSSRDWPD